MLGRRSERSNLICKFYKSISLNRRNFYQICFDFGSTRVHFLYYLLMKRSTGGKVLKWSLELCGELEHFTGRKSCSFFQCFLVPSRPWGFVTLLTSDVKDVSMQVCDPVIVGLIYSVTAFMVKLTLWIRRWKKQETCFFFSKMTYFRKMTIVPSSPCGTSFCSTW